MARRGVNLHVLCKARTAHLPRPPLSPTRTHAQVLQLLLKARPSDKRRACQSAQCIQLPDPRRPPLRLVVGLPLASVSRGVQHGPGELIAHDCCTPVASALCSLEAQTLISRYETVTCSVKRGAGSCQCAHASTSTEVLVVADCRISMFHQPQHFPIHCPHARCA